MAGDDDGRGEIGEIVAANGIDIYVERSGEGPRLLFLQGTSINGESETTGLVSEA